MTTDLKTDFDLKAAFEDIKNLVFRAKQWRYLRNTTPMTW